MDFCMSLHPCRSATMWKCRYHAGGPSNRILIKPMDSGEHTYVVEWVAGGLVKLFTRGGTGASLSNHSWCDLLSLGSLENGPCVFRYSKYTKYISILSASKSAWESQMSSAIYLMSGLTDRSRWTCSMEWHVPWKWHTAGAASAFASACDIVWEKWKSDKLITYKICIL